MPDIALAIQKIIEWQRCTHADPLVCIDCGSLLIPHLHRDRTHVVLKCSRGGCAEEFPEVPEHILEADLALCPKTRPFEFALA